MNQDPALFSDEPAPQTQNASLFSDEPLPSKTESFARGAMNNVPMLPQAVAAGKSNPGMLPFANPGLMSEMPAGIATELLTNKGQGDYSKNLQDINAKAATAKAANPISYGAGAVTGAVAPLMVPGIGEALEAAPIAGNAALGAANALSNADLSKNLGENAKQAAIGAGVGGALGGLGKAFSAAKSGVAPIGERLEANATANALDLGTYGVRKLSRAGQNPEAVLREINSDLQEELPGLIGFTDTASSKFTKLSQAHEQAGNAIGSVIDSVTAGTGKNLPEAQEALDELNAAAKQYKGLTSERALDAKAELNDAAMKLKGLKDNNQLTFKNLAALKSDIGQAYHNPNLDNRGIDQAYSIISKKIDNLLDRVGVNDPAIKAQYDKAKDVYRLTSRLIPAMQRGVAREAAGTGGGLANAALGAGAIFGHPLAAGAAYAGKTAAKLAAPDLAANTAYKTMNALKGTNLPARGGQAILNELNDFLTSRYGQRKEQ